MTDWKKVQGSQEDKPEEFDTSSSGEIVYQRRNITQIESENSDGSKTKLWDYEERKLTWKEFERIRLEDIASRVKQEKADIDFISAMTGTDL
jgi:hypothetical protein